MWTTRRHWLILQRYFRYFGWWKMNVYSNIKIERKTIDGIELPPICVKNLVVDNGLNQMRDHLIGLSAAAPLDHFILGTGTTAAYSTDTGVQTSAYTISFSTSTSYSAGVTFKGTIGTTIGTSNAGGSTYTEIGIFTSSSQLYARALLTPVLIKSTNPYTIETMSWAFAFTPSLST